MIKQLAFAAAFAAILLGLAAGLRYASDAGMLADEAAKRIIQAVIGLSLAAYANFMPKQLGPARGSPHAESLAQASLRVGGWSFTLAGLAYAGLWALAPMPVANYASMAVVAAAMLTAAGYAILAFTACRIARPSN
jgi:hypothetical protein